MHGGRGRREQTDETIITILYIILYSFIILLLSSHIIRHALGEYEDGWSARARARERERETHRERERDRERSCFMFKLRCGTVHVADDSTAINSQLFTQVGHSDQAKQKRRFSLRQKRSVSEHFSSRTNRFNAASSNTNVNYVAQL